MPVFIIFILTNVDLNTENKINIGLFYENPTIKKNIHGPLISYSEDTINFIVFESEEDLIGSVSSYHVDCGYSFKSGSYKKSIKLYKTNTTTSDTVLNIFLSSLAVRNRAGELGASVLKNYLEEVNVSEIQEGALKYSAGGPLMKIRYDNIDGGETEAVSFDNLFYGLFAISAMFISILNASWLINERGSEIYGRVKLSCPYMENAVSQLVALFCVNICYLFICNLVLSAVYNTNFKVFNIICVDILYSLWITLISFLLGRYFKKDNFLVPLAVFAFIFNFAVSGAIVDISEILGQLGFIKYFSVVYFYLKLLAI
jgi:hypothetical protein